MRFHSKQLVLTLAILLCRCPSVLQGNTATTEDDHEKAEWIESARAYQRELDVNPSSAKAHEGLGIALFRQLAAQGARPADYNDLVDRATAHLKEASQLQPAAPGPLLALSDLEAFLARAFGRSGRTQQPLQRSPGSFEARTVSRASEAGNLSAAGQPGTRSVWPATSGSEGPVWKECRSDPRRRATS
jgi:hypothetical protein